MRKELLEEKNKEKETRIIELSKKELIKLVIKKEEQIAELRERCEELEKRLRIYENPHIPSSKHIIKTVKIVRKPRKRGAPKGHKGNTRETPSPDIIVELKPRSCPRCNCRKIRILKKRKKTIEDIRIIKVVTEFYYYECLCEKCDKKFVTSDEELPKKGKFGPNILSLWGMLHYHGTIPFDRLSTISKECFNMEITPGGIHNAIYRTTTIFEPYFKRIKNRVIKSNYVRSDETTYPFNGLRYWLWNISTKKDTIVLLRQSRGAKVLKEMFGNFLDAVLNSDCLRTYDRFKAKEYQKDWAHVLRDARDLAKHNEEGIKLYKILSRMHNYIKKVKERKKENTPKVKLWVRQAKKKINSWLDKNYQSKAVLNLVLRMSKYNNQWFTCLKYPFVESTNNESERDIRKNVVARKISGQHRSELGMHSREIMMSTILTLQKRNKNPFEFVQNEIEKYNLSSKVS